MALTPLAYSRAEVAELFGTSPGMIGRLVKHGELGEIRIGRLSRIPRSEVERFLDLRKPKNDPDDHPDDETHNPSDSEEE